MWYKLRFMLQRHTLPISRFDAIEASTFQGVRFGEVISMFSIRLQSYGGFPNISLSTTFTLFSLHFPPFHRYRKIYRKSYYFADRTSGQSFERAFKRTIKSSGNRLFDFSIVRQFEMSISRHLELSTSRMVDRTND